MTEFNIPEHDYRHVMYTTLKNEGPYVLDWIAYHLKIGFTHFAIATNDCDDGTDNLLRQLENFGIVTHRNNPSPHPQGIQKHGFMRLQDLECIEKAEWLMHLDIDEFLRIDIGNGHVDDLVSAIVGGEAQALSLVCQIFGNHGVTQLVDEPVFSQFKYAAHPLQAAPQPVCELKTFYKNGYFKKLSPNRPLGLSEDADFKKFDWLDGDGVSNTKMTQNQIFYATQNGFAFGTAIGRVNRYAVQSLDAFANKWSRGFAQFDNPMASGEMSAKDYWLRNNWNIVKEERILTHLDEVEKIKELLTEDQGLLNPVAEPQKVKKLHKKAFRIHQQWANQKRRQEKEFFDDFVDLKPLTIESEYPLIEGESHVPQAEKWFMNRLFLNRKLISSKFLKDYIKDVDYGPEATEIPEILEPNVA